MMIEALPLYGDIRSRHSWPRSLLASLLIMVERARQRRALAGFDDRLLADIGVSRVDAARETNKPCWRD